MRTERLQAVERLLGKGRVRRDPEKLSYYLAWYHALTGWTYEGLPDPVTYEEGWRDARRFLDSLPLG